MMTDVPQGKMRGLTRRQEIKWFEGLSDMLAKHQVHYDEMLSKIGIPSIR